MPFLHFLSTPSFPLPLKQDRTKSEPNLHKVVKKKISISMAVEARHLNLFPSQLLGNREMTSPIEGNAGFYNTQMGFVHGVPLSGTTTAETTTLLPMYGCSVIADSVAPKPTTAAAMKSDSGLTYNLPAVSRKRSRIEASMINPLFISHNSSPQTQKTPTLFSFLGEDLSLQIQQHQFDIDRLVSQHMEKVRIEIEEKRKRQARRIVEALEEGMVKRLRAKEEEIEKIGKLNWALEERVKSLCVENQIWRELAQSNQATANALRSNLEQVLAQQVRDAGAPDEDAESCCGSTGVGNDTDGWRVQDSNNSRWCRSCGKEESCVLLLPCRHLCLCTACGSKLHTCPICKATKNASVHVNMS